MLGLPYQVTQLPDQSLSEDDMRKKYGSINNFYRATAQHLSTYYNRAQPSEYNKTSAGVGTGEISQILDNFNYFHGIQANSEFAYLSETLDESGKLTDMATPYMAGQDISSILVFMLGQFLGAVANSEPRIDVINPESKNKLTEQIKIIEATKKFKAVIEKMTEATGMEFQSPVQNTNASTEDIVRTLQTSTNSKFVRYANIILDYVKKNGMSDSDYRRALTHVLVGRRANIYVDTDGRLHNIEPYNYAKVSYKDDDFGKYDFARGMVQRLHKDDFLAKYADELTQKEIDEVRSGSFTELEGFSNFSNLYNYDLYNQERNDMSVITWFWKSTLDTGYDVKEDEDGNKKVYKVRSKKGKKGKPVQVIRRATIAANWIVVDYGIHDVIEDPNQVGNKLFPICSFEPDTYLGINKSLTDKLKNKQKELDAINQRVRDNYTMDLGTILSFNGKKFKNGMTPEQIYQQLRRTRVTVSVASGNEDDITNNEPMMQREDVSLMRDIQNYLAIKKELQQDIKDIANVSAITMGSQNTYVGLRTQQNSQALATNSVQYYYTGVFQLFADAAAMATEYVRKDIKKNPTKQKWLSLLGDDGVEMMNYISKQPLWKLQAYISTRDIIDPIRKQRMLAMLDNLMATGQIDFEDWLRVEDAKTITELKDYAKYSVNKKREMAQIQAMIDNASQVQKTEALAQGQAQTKAIEQQGMDKRNASDNITKLADTMIKKGASMEEVNAYLSGEASEGQQQQMPQGQPMPQ